MNTRGFTEKDILNACIRGDKEAWDAFVEKYTNLIYHTVHKALKKYSSDYLYHEIEDIHNSIFCLC